MKDTDTKFVVASPEDAQKLLELLALEKTIEGIDLDQIEKERDEVEKYIEKLRGSGPVSRLTKKPRRKEHSATCSGKCRGNCGANHYQARRKKKRIYNNTVAWPRHKARLARDVDERGWFAAVESGWKRKGIPYEITEDEWKEYVKVGPTQIPVVSRYDTKLPFTLDNVVVRDSKTDKILFDGKEHLLRKLGYTL